MENPDGLTNYLSYILQTAVFFIQIQSCKFIRKKSEQRHQPRKKENQFIRENARNHAIDHDFDNFLKKEKCYARNHANL